jgi:hypothetical protein
LASVYVFSQWYPYAYEGNPLQRFSEFKTDVYKYLETGNTDDGFAAYLCACELFNSINFAHRLYRDQRPALLNLKQTSVSMLSLAINKATVLNDVSLTKYMIELMAQVQ